MITYDIDMDYDVIQFNQVDRDNIREVGIIHFQNGPVKEYGENGVDMISAVNAITDRLIKLNEEHDDDFNEIAIFHLLEASEMLKKRYRYRFYRGVEGTNAK